MDGYEQNLNVIRLHNFPRFGHSNHLASIANEEGKDDYIRGMRALPMFLACAMAVWGLLLIIFLCGGVPRWGCAAGGEVVNIAVLRSEGVRRWQRRARILRSWRLQSVFGLASFCLITFSFVFVNQGLTPLVDSLAEITTATGLLRSHSRQGMHLAHLLGSHMALLRPFLDLQVEQVCPNYADSILASELGLAVANGEITLAVNELDTFLQVDIDPLLDGVDQVADACTEVDLAVAKAEENDWMIRLFLMTVNVINIFLFIGVVLTRNRVISDFYQSVVSVVCLPFFSLTTACATIVLVVTAVLAMANADFCSGGVSPGSPMGTLVDFVTTSGYGRATFLYETIDYYTADECQGLNPLAFLRDLETTVVTTHGHVLELSQTLKGFDLEDLSSACGADFSTVLTSFEAVEPILEDVATALQRVLELTACDKVSPILDDLAYGPTCHQTVNALTWMFYTALVITLLMMIMLTTRAALFNAIVPLLNTKRREKEYRQYKRFMEDSGYDTSDWLMDPEKKKLAGLLIPTETFDTEDSDSMMKLTPTGDEDFEDESSEHYSQEEEESDEHYEPADDDETADPQASRERDEKEEERVDENDDYSVYSSGSDDSSLNGPPSVISNVASSVASSVSSAMMRMLRFRRNSLQYSVSSGSQDASPYGRPSVTPVKSPASILGPMYFSPGSQDEVDEQEMVPLSPSPQPAAPKKLRTKLARTRGAKKD